MKTTCWWPPRSSKTAWTSRAQHHHRQPRRPPRALAELYQLRGRVGRSNRRAYAYLLIPPDDELTPIARRRLAALKEFSDLGAGFRSRRSIWSCAAPATCWAAEQNGHINAVGFELYPNMLEHTVREMKGEVRAGGGRGPAQPGPRHPHSRRLHPGREPAPADVQARGRGGERGAAQRRARGTGRPLRRAAAGGAQPAGVRAAQAGQPAAGRGGDRPPSRPGDDPLHPGSGASIRRSWRTLSPASLGRSSRPAAC